MCGLPIILELFSNWICKTKVSSKIICMHPKYRQKRGSEREQVLGRVFDSIIACSLHVWRMGGRASRSGVVRHAIESCD